MGPVAARRVDHDRPQTHPLTRRRESPKKESGGAKHLCSTRLAGNPGADPGGKRVTP